VKKKSAQPNLKAVFDAIVARYPELEVERDLRRHPEIRYKREIGTWPRTLDARVYITMEKASRKGTWQLRVEINHPTTTMSPLHARVFATAFEEIVEIGMYAEYCGEGYVWSTKECERALEDIEFAQRMEQSAEEEA
jgi:hypothetical protein